MVEQCIVCNRIIKQNNSKQMVKYCSGGLCKASKNKKGREKVQKLLIKSTQLRKREEAERRKDEVKCSNDC